MREGPEAVADQRQSNRLHHPCKDQAAAKGSAQSPARIHPVPPGNIRLSREVHKDPGTPESQKRSPFNELPRILGSGTARDDLARPLAESSLARGQRGAMWIATLPSPTQGRYLRDARRSMSWLGCGSGLPGIRDQVLENKAAVLRIGPGGSKRTSSPRVFTQIGTSSGERKSQGASFLFPFPLCVACTEAYGCRHSPQGRCKPLGRRTSAPQR